MRRFTAWLAGAAGGLAAYTLLRRRAKPAESAAETPDEHDPRAEELRAKLAETRDAPEPAAPEDVESRRASVHEQGRAAIDEMRGEAPPADG